MVEFLGENGKVDDTLETLVCPGGGGGDGGGAGGGGGGGDVNPCSVIAETSRTDDVTHIIKRSNAVF